MEEQLIINEIDVECIRAERRVNTTFAANKANCPGKEAVRISTEFVNSKDLNLTRTFNPHPFVPQGSELNSRCEEIFSIQIAGLAQRLLHTGAKTAVIGISGGLDSTLALLVCVKTFDKLGLSRKDILGITMPGFGTTDRTYHNAIDLMNSLGVSIREISIREACIQHFKDIGHDLNIHDVTYENSQARERTQILMDIANQTWGMVIGTGDLSELALGWATYNGDHMSMYGVNAGIPKTLVKHLVQWVAENGMDEASKATLLDIVDTPISPELIRQMGRVIAIEASAQGAHIGYGPVLDLARDPRWSRVEETYGEDPYLNGVMGTALVRGFQGETLNDGKSVIATLKHFASYGWTEGGHNGGTAHIGERELEEAIFPPFFVRR